MEIHWNQARMIIKSYNGQQSTTFWQTQYEI